MHRLKGANIQNLIIRVPKKNKGLMDLERVMPYTEQPFTGFSPANKCAFHSQLFAVYTRPLFTRQMGH